MTVIHVDIVYGPSADALLGNHQFLALWRNLYDECPHATAFQTPSFVRAWYGAYRAQWQPVIVQSNDSNGGLTGLWLLAYNPITNVLSHAGTHQAEYHVWLALPGKDASFLAAAWAELKRRFAFTTLRFKYLPNSELGETLQSAIGRVNRVAVRLHSRPLLVLNSNDMAAPGHRYMKRINHLKKLGKLEFRHLTNPAELERIFDDLIAYYDFRQGALYHSSPFRVDPQKRRFHTDWFAAAQDEAYVTATYLDERPIAAFWGAVSGKMVHFGLLFYSPFVAELSPGKLHTMQLSEHLSEAGKDVLDLTPGGDLWKERFANAHDKVAEAIVYRSQWTRIQADARDVLSRWAKRSAARVGIAPNNVRTTLAALRRARPSSVYREIRNWIAINRECRIYRADRVLAKDYRCDVRVQCNSLRDLISFEPAESWQTREGFLSGAFERLEHGEFVYTVSIDNRLAHYGWMVDGKTESKLHKVEQSMNIPPGSVTFYDFYSFPEFRCQGLYRATIGHMLCVAFSNEKTQYAYIAVLADNLPSRHVIETMGFEYQGSFYWQRRFGTDRKWNGPMLALSEDADAQH